MFCVYIGNSKVYNTARDVCWGVIQASRVQEERFSLAIYNWKQKIVKQPIKFTDSHYTIVNLYWTVIE